MLEYQPDLMPASWRTCESKGLLERVDFFILDDCRAQRAFCSRADRLRLPPSLYVSSFCVLLCVPVLARARGSRCAGVSRGARCHSECAHTRTHAHRHTHPRAPRTLASALQPCG